MNTKTKSALMLLLTLLIGIIVGVLGGHMYMEHRVTKFMAMRNDRFFQHRMEEFLQPRPDQLDTLNAIFEKYQPKFLQLNRSFRAESRAILDSLHKELEPVLTKEQLQRLKERRGMPPFGARPFGRQHPDGPFGKPRGMRGPRDQMPPHIPPEPDMPRP